MPRSAHSGRTQQPRRRGGVREDDEEQWRLQQLRQEEELREFCDLESRMTMQYAAEQQAKVERLQATVRQQQRELEDARAESAAWQQRCAELEASRQHELLCSATQRLEADSSVAELRAQLAACSAEAHLLRFKVAEAQAEAKAMRACAGRLSADADVGLVLSAAMDVRCRQQGYPTACKLRADLLAGRAVAEVVERPAAAGEAAVERVLLPLGAAGGKPAGTAASVTLARYPYGPARSVAALLPFVPLAGEQTLLGAYVQPRVRSEASCYGGDDGGEHCSRCFYPMEMVLVWTQPAQQQEGKQRKRKQKQC